MPPGITSLRTPSTTGRPTPTTSPNSWGRRPARGSTFSAIGADDELVGWFAFSCEGDCVEFGLGLRPDLTGRGLGLAYLEAGLAFAGQRFTPRWFRLSVAAFNERAIRVYERAGFAPLRTFDHATNGGVHRFLEMTRPAGDKD